MYICRNCKASYEEMPTCREDLGYAPITREVEDNCCYCGGVIVEGKECKICFRIIADDEQDICEDCLSDNATFENAIKYGEEMCENIAINDYLIREFTKEQIEAILIRELKEAERLGTKLKYKEYLLQDKYQFSDWIIKNEQL